LIVRANAGAWNVPFLVAIVRTAYLVAEGRATEARDLARTAARDADAAACELAALRFRQLARSCPDLRADAEAIAESIAHDQPPP
jgi:hypothetical protein